MFRMAVGHSDDVDLDAALREIFAQVDAGLAEATPGGGLLFAAWDLDHAAILAAVHERYPGVELCGTTSAREMSSILGFQEDSIVLALFAAGGVAGGGRHGAPGHRPAATAVFSDIVGFTDVAASLPASALVEELGALIGAFDEICGRTGVEKIKTIGDAYLAVGGLPGTATDHAAAAADTALAMDTAIAALDSRRVAWRLRIGLHIGPCVAGVIGSRKFAYDVWGDTINLASRLQTSSEPGRIHVSSAMAAALAGRYRLEPRGEVELKGVGRAETFFLLGAAG